MIKNKIFRRLALMISLIMLLTSTVQTTFGFIVTSTGPLKNTFVPYDSAASDLIISKTVEHPFGESYIIPDDIAFDFEVDLGALYANTKIQTTDGDKTADENGVITVSVEPGGYIGIEGLDEGREVTVTEVQKDAASGFAVKDGIATQKVTIFADGSARVNFVNIYTPAAVQPTGVTVSGTKILEGREWQEGDTFLFLLEQETGDDIWTDLGTRAITYDAENADFNKFYFSNILQALTFDKAGSYDFRISEVAGELDNVDYDKTVNYFTVEVGDKDMDGKLEISDVTGSQNAAVTKDETTGEYNVDVTFNNTFIPDPEDISVAVTVNKTVKNTGSLSIGPEGFEFVLENTASGDKTALKTDENGKAIFDLDFTAADVGKTFNYKLSETDTGKTGVTYDTDVYDIQIDIALGEDNTLIPTVTMNGTTVESCAADFENTYHTEQSPSPPTGENSNTAFWFIMMIISGATCVALLLLDRRYKASTKN